MEFLPDISILDLLFGNPSAVPVSVGLAVVGLFLYKLARRAVFMGLTIVGLPVLASAQFSQSSNLPDSISQFMVGALGLFFILGLLCSRPFKGGKSFLLSLLSLLIVLVNCGLLYLAYSDITINFGGFALTREGAVYCLLSFIGGALLISLIRALISFIPAALWASCGGVIFLVFTPGMPDQLLDQLPPSSSYIEKLSATPMVQQVLPSLVEVISGFATNQEKQ